MFENGEMRTVGAIVESNFIRVRSVSKVNIIIIIIIIITLFKCQGKYLAYRG